MSRIENYIKEFEGYLNGNWDDEEKAAFNERLGADHEMQRAWTEYQSILDAVSDKEAVSFRLMLNSIYSKRFDSSGIHRLSDSIWFRFSAAAVFIVLVGCLLYFFCTNRGREFAIEDKFTDTIEMAVEDSNALVVDGAIDTILGKESIEDPPPKIASIYEDERYQISPAYAELLHNVYRSYWFSLSSPVDSVLFEKDDSITFSWESNIHEPLYFDVLDRKGKVVYRHKDSIESPWTYKPVLDPAIYMFRFSTKEQPVWMGVMVGR